MWKGGGSSNGVGRKGGEGWGPQGWGPKGGGSKGGSPKFRAFFSFSHLHFHSFFLSLVFFPLWGSSRGILVVFWSVGTSHVLVFAFRLSCGSPRKTREDPQREKKRMKVGVGEGKKSAEILGGRAEGGPAEGRGVRGSTQILDQHTQQTQQTHTQQTHTHNTHNNTHTHQHHPPTHTHTHTDVIFFLSRVRFFNLSRRFFCPPRLCLFCPVSVFFVPVRFFWRNRMSESTGVAHLPI